MFNNTYLRSQDNLAFMDAEATRNEAVDPDLVLADADEIERETALEGIAVLGYN